MAVKTLMTDETGLLIAEAIREKAKLEDRVTELEKNKVDKSSIAQTTGTAEDKVMSQKAVTEELEKKFDESNVVQSTGDAEDKVMSQAAATKEFGKLLEEIDIQDILHAKQAKVAVNFAASANKTSDAAAAIEKSVPYNILPYAEVVRIGGRCVDVDGNLIPCKIARLHITSPNLCDEKWRIPNWNKNILEMVSYLPVSANTKYFITFPVTMGYPPNVHCYDSGKNQLNTLYPGLGVFTTPENCAYIRVSLPNAYGLVYHSDICINIYDKRINGTYYQYLNETFEVPAEVLALEGYGEGDPNNIDVYNYYDLSKNCFVQLGKVVDGAWKMNATPVVTTVDAVDNLIPGKGATKITTDLDVEVPYTIAFFHDDKGLTSQQIAALDDLFKACAYTTDSTAVYTAFKAAFAIEED